MHVAATGREAITTTRRCASSRPNLAFVAREAPQTLGAASGIVFVFFKSEMQNSEPKSRFPDGCVGSPARDLGQSAENRIRIQIPRWMREESAARELGQSAESRIAGGCVGRLRLEISGFKVRVGAGVGFVNYRLPPRGSSPSSRQDPPPGPHPPPPRVAGKKRKKQL